MKRIATLIAAGSLAAAALLAGCTPKASAPEETAPAQAAALPEVTLPDVTMYKSPTCGCCGKWAEHMKQSGFAVKTVEVADVAAVKQQHGVPGDLSSCHTAVVDGYVVEGHVPADVVRQLLAERPAIAGISVPGMPMGSPGMEQGGEPERYDVLAIGRRGERYVYASR